ncbi:TetR/AcrR family transcriptional regulator [Paenibacillus sp. 276b]|uniref:TetR/AcrR family transcriptional regulator n=1 Tax=Paenibacillus sp. 276b TaxID=1566277 RepID=UPI00210AEDD3|nr:TetR/AcrR family transcriptional regulator [Paenibacillus sp. 276b]
MDAAKNIFASNSFEQATMQDIAKEANLGIATIFRYFPKKEQLIVAVASDIVQTEIEVFSNIVHGSGTCYEKLNHIFDAFIFFQRTEDRSSSKLIEAFECYVALSKEPLEDIDLYRAQYDSLIALFTELAELGKLDGSVRTDINTVNTLLTMIHVFGNFSKKMAMLHGIEAFQLQVDQTEQFQILKRLFLEPLKA